MEPAKIPVTKAEIESILALVVSDELHKPPVMVEENILVPPTQMESIPLKIPALGGAVKVIVLVELALEHPPVPETE